MIRLNNQRTRYVLVLLLSSFYLSAYGQDNKRNPQSREFYGTNIIHSLNGLVLNRTVIGGQYQLNRRTFDLGLLMNEFSNFSGFVFKHRYFLNRSESGEVYNPASYALRPHLFYRFVYNNQMPEAFLAHPTQAGESFEITEHEQHTINTIEHYLGIGLEVDISERIYLNTSVSGGFYFFKDNMEAVEIDGQLLPKATTGFVFNVSTGLGCYF
ncbi:MAG: hypothetical protein ACLFM7_13930 [Bacteroidales bacterium]